MFHNHVKHILENKLPANVDAQHLQSLSAYLDDQADIEFEKGGLSTPSKRENIVKSLHDLNSFNSFSANKKETDSVVSEFFDSRARAKNVTTRTYDNSDLIKPPDYFGIVYINLPNSAPGKINGYY